MRTTSAIKYQRLHNHPHEAQTMSPFPPEPPPPGDERPSFDLNLQHGHKDLVQSVAFNAYGDRCAAGSVDGKIRVFNRHRDGTWRHCDNWNAHASEVVEVLAPHLPGIQMAPTPP